MRKIRAIVATLAAGGVIAAGTVFATAGGASAATGEWGYLFQTGNLQHGTQTFNPFGPGSGLFCLDGTGCDFDSTMRFNIQAVNGTTFSPVGARANIDVVFGQTNIGECIILTPQLIECNVNSSGHVLDGSNTGNGLIVPGWNTGVTITVPADVPVGAAAVKGRWFDSNGMWGSNPEDNDFVDLVRPNAPIA